MDHGSWIECENVWEVGGKHKIVFPSSDISIQKSSCKQCEWFKAELPQMP